MTVSSATSRKAFTGDGTTTSFGTTPVVFFETDNLLVYVVTNSTGAIETLVEDTDYTVTGGDGSTGTVSLAGGSSPYGAPAVGTTLVILRELPVTQEFDPEQNDGSDAEALEDAIDRVVMIQQQIAEQQGRTLRVAVSEDEQDEIDVVGKDGYYLRRNLAGTAFELAAGDQNDSTYTASGTDAVERTVTAKLGEIVSVKDFGAVGDGSTDDTDAIQAAIDAVLASPQHRVLYFPPPQSAQSYVVSNPLLITGPIKLIGAGSNACAVKGVGMSTGEAIFDIDGTVDPNLDLVEIVGFTLLSDNNSPDLISLDRASIVALRDIVLRSARYGVLVTGNRAFSITFDRVMYQTGTMTRSVIFSAYTGGGHVTFNGCSFGGTLGCSVTSDSRLNQLSFVGCNFEDATNEGLLINGDVWGLTIHGCRFEKNLASQEIFIDPATGKIVGGVSINGCFFETDAASRAILIGGSGGTVRGFNICGNSASDYSASFVHLNGAGDGGIIAGNQLKDVAAAVNTNRTGVLTFNNLNNATAIEPTLTSATVQDYTVTNPSVSRSIDVSAATLGQTNAVLGTLITDLIAWGIIK